LSAYFEFTITPDAGKQVTLFDLSFGSRSTPTGPQAYSVRSSIDNYSTEIASGSLANNSTWVLTDPVTTATTAYPSIPVTYRIYGINGTGTASSGTVNWRIDDLTIRIMVDNMAACNGTITAGTASAGLPGPFCETGATTLSLVGNSNPATTLGVQLQWYSSTDNVNFTAITGADSSAYNTGTIGETIYYYAVATCAISNSTDTSNIITLEVSERPEISGNLIICSGGSTLLTSTAAASYQWNLNGAPIAGATSQTYLASAGGDYTVTTTTSAGCVLSSDVATVIIAGTLTAPEVTGLVNMCPFEGTGEEVTFTIAPQPGVTTYNWNLPPLVNLVSGQGTEQITVTILPGFTARANKQIRVTGTSACGETPMTIYYLESHRPMSPGFISGPVDACPLIGTANTATYSISPVIAATSYNWTVPAGATIVSHPAGTGINDTIITVSFDGSYATGYVSVEAVNNCGISINPRNLTVVRNNPPTPGPISGTNNACVLMPTAGNPTGTTAEYTIRAIPGALSYNWTVPAGATIESHPNGAGVNDTVIVVSFSSGFTGGAITVSATDNCGTGLSRTLNINATLKPSSIGTITATETQVCPDRQVRYSITMPLNATWIQWTAPAAGSIVSGQGTNSILVTYSGAPVSGSVTATASNGCATGSTRSLAVDLAPCAPPSPFAKTSGTFIPGTEVDLLEATVFPNPSATTFRLKVNNHVKEQLQVRVFDVQGKPLERFQMRAGETREFGQKMMPGVYFIRLINFVCTQRLQSIISCRCAWYIDRL
ncbi:MAG: T9SS type A sorting domain-containing protein, partial [Sphingobacteriales bacterium]